MHTTYKEWIENGKPKVICKCGCGEEVVVKDFHKYYGIPKYINGHQVRDIRQKISDANKGRVAWNKGIPHTEETKQKIHENHPNFSGENHPMFGKHHSEETKQKMSDAKSGENHPMFGKHHSEETKEKISNGNKGKIISDKAKEKMRLAKEGMFLGEDNPNYGKGLFGEENPNWQGGKSFGKYCPKFNKPLKKQIRNRDNRTCQLCGKTEEENVQLNIHHIHYDKENCYPDLITLCRSCNSKVNFNRDYWEEYFMKILEEKGLLNYFGVK